MSLILATQDEGDMPYSFINHFQNTIEIKPNSSIALNHVTVNREFLLDFDEDKVFMVSHSRALPEEIPLRMSSIDPGLAARTETLLDTDLLPFVHYPQPVIIPKGQYGIESFRKMLEFRLNNPSSQYGGDYWVTGDWTVSVIENSTTKATIGFNFDWDSTTNHVAALIPAVSEVINFQQTFVKNFSYSAGGAFVNTGVGAIYDSCGIVNRFMSTNDGEFVFDGTAITKNAIVGLSRYTDGNYFQQFGENTDSYFMGFKPLEFGADYDSFTKGYDFFDYCLRFNDNNEVELYQLTSNTDEFANYDGWVCGMEKVDYVTDPKGAGNVAVVTNGPKHWYKFIISGEDVSVKFSVDNGVTFTNLSTGQLKPLNNYTCQLVPKITMKESGETVTIKSFNPVAVKHNPIRPFSNPLQAANLDEKIIINDVNHFWGFMWLNKFPRLVEDPDTDEEVDLGTDCFMRENLHNYLPMRMIDPDLDSTLAMPIGTQYNTTTILEELEIQWWAFNFTSPDVWDYNFQKTLTGKSFIFKGGNNIIAFDVTGRFFDCRPTINNALGIPRPFFHDVEHIRLLPSPADVARIVANKDFSTTSNDILYLRLNVGDVLTGNGATNSLSRIISPIVATGENANESGIRTYLPTERMYLKLNNTASIYMDSIRVEIVTDKETWARELGGTTSCSFHIVENKDL